MATNGRRLQAVGIFGSILLGAVPVMAQSHGGHSGGSHLGAAMGGHARAGSYSYGSQFAHGYRPGVQGTAFVGGRGYGRPVESYGRGYLSGAHWSGGYWSGVFWPRAYYGARFSWFLPILPLAYATYWYGGNPYYYANDVYYTYDGSRDGYVATDPPPVADSSAEQMFMYPKNGQTPEQQATDKAECQQWAAQQAGPVAQNGANYQRAMSACVEGRGYTAR